MSRVRLLMAALVVSVAFGYAVEAQAVPPTGWDSTILLRGQERAAVKAMPIEKRPMRPLHIYGNTIRRIEYRGQR